MGGLFRGQSTLRSIHLELESMEKFCRAYLKPEVVCADEIYGTFESGEPNEDGEFIYIGAGPLEGHGLTREESPVDGFRIFRVAVARVFPARKNAFAAAEDDVPLKQGIGRVGVVDALCQSTDAQKKDAATA